MFLETTLFIPRRIDQCQREVGQHSDNWQQNIQQLENNGGGNGVN